MLDFDRRSFVVGSTAGAALATASVAGAATLAEGLAMALGVSAPIAAIVAARLDWGARKPRVLFASSVGDRLQPVFGLVPGAAEIRGDGLPPVSVVAIYDGRTPAAGVYRAVPSTEVAACGVRMKTFRAAGRHACVLSPMAIEVGDSFRLLAG